MNAPAESFMATLDAMTRAADAGEARRAALLLHTVSAEDRAWLLSQLDAAHRMRLQELVDELRSIGIPPAPELLDELGPVGPRADDAPAQCGLRQADGAALAIILAAEPAELIARVISLGPWSWTGALLARLGALQRQQVMDHLTTLSQAAASEPSALDLRLLTLVEARLAQALDETAATRPAFSAAGGRTSGHRLWRWLGQARTTGAANGARHA